MPTWCRTRQVEEKFFEDFDFLDHELDGKNSPVHTPTGLAIPTVSGDTASDSEDGAGEDDNASLPDGSDTAGRSRAVSLHVRGVFGVALCVRFVLTVRILGLSVRVVVTAVDRV